MRVNDSAGIAHSQRDKSSAFVLDIWQDQPGKYFCISIASPSRDYWHDQFFTRDHFHKITSYIHHHVKMGYDVFFATNGCRERTRKSAIRGVWLYADLDLVNPFKLDIEPTLALMTSPKSYQAWWRGDDVVGEDLAKVFRSHVKADPDCYAVNKVLRIPGTINRKLDYKPSPRVKLILDGGSTYSTSELEQRLVEPRRERLRKRRPATRAMGNVPVERLMRWASVRQCMYPASDGKRSDVIAKLIYALDDKGCSRDGIAWALLRCPSFISKHGHDEDRAHWEIDNCLRNKR